LESGSHFELLMKPGSRYAELWHSQHKFADGVPPKSKEGDDKKRHVHPQLDFDMFRDDGCCKQGGCNR
uniref:Myostatin n=1 Tax=Anisakis simplex TaxID=6269 RepID=A0A0M3KKE0_ANISI